MREAQFAIDTEALRTSERALTLIEAHREECTRNKQEIITEIKLNREESNSGRASLHARIARIWQLALLGMASTLGMTLVAAGVMAWAILSRVK